MKMNAVNSSNHYYHPLAVANYLVILGKADKKASIDLLKLLKITYLAHGWSLVLYDTPLISEAPEVWPYGPIIPSIYYEFNVSGKEIIKKPATYYNLDTADWETPIIKNDNQVETLLKKVWTIYKGFTGIDLSKMTHLKHSAWYKTKKINQENGINPIRNANIDNELIRDEIEYWKNQFEKTSNTKILSLNDL